jgi:hypothetical protein
MIYVKLLGGLGNQMFQYAMGRKLSILHQSSMRFEVDGLKAGEDIRTTYELGIFNIPKIDFAKREEIFPFRRKTIFKSEFLCQVVNYLQKRSMIVESGHLPFSQKFVDDSTTNCYVRGLWQTEKYFNDVQQTIRGDFEFKEPLDGKNLELANILLNEPAAVSLHVRRGEFANDPKYAALIGTCDVNYFKSAMEIFVQRIGTARYIVFSDDLDWVKSQQFLPDSAIYVDYNQKANHFRDMQLMSLCKHNIISNSTFSWWGAWLNKNPNKVVVAPKKWFAGWEHDTRDLIPDSWVRI